MLLQTGNYILGAITLSPLKISRPKSFFALANKCDR